MVANGLFPLAMLFWQKCQQQRQSMFLPWPPWAMQQEIEQSYLCRAAQGGQGKNNGEHHLFVACRCCQRYRDKLCQTKHSLSQ